LKDLFEKYMWLTPEFKVKPTDGKTVKIKGKAIPRETISRNNRKYVDEELRRAARTFIDTPVTENHHDWMEHKNHLGKVNWMEYEDGSLEYVAEVWNPSMVAELRLYAQNPGASKVRGVSIEADFLHIKCAKCGEQFYAEETWRDHMVNVERVRDLPLEPHGIRGRALSIVTGTEIPGVMGNTLEVMETVERGVSQLLETVIKYGLEEEKIKLDKIAVRQNDSHVAVGRTKTITDTDVSDAIYGKPKVEAVTPTLNAEKTLEPKTPIEEPAIPAVVAPAITETILRPAETITLKESQLTTINEITAAKLSLGEPFGGYSDFAACVKANQDKDNPEAYCGKIKHETEEMVTVRANIKQITQKLNEIIQEQNKPTKVSLPEVKAPAPYDDKPLRETISGIKPYDDKELREMIAAIPKDDLGWKEIKLFDPAPITAKIAEVEAKIPVAYNDASLQASIKALQEGEVKAAELLTGKTAELHSQIKTLTETIEKYRKENQDLLAAADHNVKEFIQKKQVEDKAKDEELKKLKETVENQAVKLQETAKLAENTDDKLKPQFKGHSKQLKEQVSPDFNFKPGGK